MKIVAHTPTELIIRDSAMSLRALGAFLVALAAFIVWIGMTQDPERIGIFPLVVGAIVALGGVAMLALPSRKTFAFSRTERVFIIAKERFGRVQRQTIPLRDIIDVSVEESTSSESGSTYRVAMTLSDQLFEGGVFAQGIAFPTVARDKARVRTIVTATHTRADLQFALDTFGRVGKALGIV